MKSNPRLRGDYEKLAAAREAEKCVFCDLRDKYVVIHGKLATLTVNIFPYIDGQLLILPYRHVERMEELNSKEVTEILKLTQQGKTLLEKSLNIKNFWIILREGETSGKTIKHLHINILPYIDGLNTWHHQEIKIEPKKLASKLRRYFQNDRN